MISVTGDVSGIMLRAPAEAMAELAAYTPTAMQVGMAHLARHATLNIEDRTVTRTGQLKRSVQLLPIAQVQRGFAAAVVVQAPYAGYLEDGTRHIEPRRFMADAYDKEGPVAAQKTVDMLEAKLRELDGRP